MNASLFNNGICFEFLKSIKSLDSSFVKHIRERKFENSVQSKMDQRATSVAILLILLITFFDSSAIGAPNSNNQIEDNGESEKKLSEIFWPSYIELHSCFRW